MYSKKERQALAAANKLAKALIAIEEYDGDPTDILCDAEIIMIHAPKGAVDALKSLFSWYNV